MPQCARVACYRCKDPDCQSLFLSQKRDALTNFHFTPKPLQADMQVKSNNLPSIAMEDVTPAAVRCVHAMPAGM